MSKSDRAVSKVVGVALMLVIVLLLAMMLMMSVSSIASTEIDDSEDDIEEFENDTRPSDGNHDGSGDGDGSDGDGSDGDGDGSDGDDLVDSIDGSGVVVVVVDSDGNPVSGQSVDLYVGQHSTWGPPAMSGTTNGDGKVAFDSEAGNHAVVVFDSWGDKLFAVPDGEAVVVTVQQG